MSSLMIHNVHMAFRMSFAMFVMFHTLACIWIYIGSNEEGGWQDNFLLEYQKNDATVIYVNAFYFVATTASTIGYGDIHPKLQNEYFFIFFLEFVGICIFSTIASYIYKLSF